MQITSPAFTHNTSMPSKYTCDGEKINPPLEFHDIPAGTISLVLLMDDPDVPKNLRPDGMWDHWVLYNIPPTISKIEEGKEPEGSVGLNTGGFSGYYPACPPDGQHRYFFKLYALDELLSFEKIATVTKATVQEAMQGHILAQAELIGLYERH